MKSPAMTAWQNAGSRPSESTLTFFMSASYLHPSKRPPKIRGLSRHRGCEVRYLTLEVPMRERFQLAALCALLSLVPAVAGAAGGIAYVSDTINWSQTPPLYFSVAGAPPNTCGALVTVRNNQYIFSPGWI